MTKNNAWAHSFLADELHRNGKTDEALIHYTKALDIDPTYLAANMSLATIYLEKGEIAGALKHFRKVLSTADNQHTALHISILPTWASHCP